MKKEVLIPEQRSQRLNFHMNKWKYQNHPQKRLNSPAGVKIEEKTTQTN